MPRPINTETKLGIARASIGVSARRLSSASGVGLSTIQQIEQGRYVLTIDTAIKLAKALTVPVSRLMPKEIIDEEIARCEERLVILKRGEIQKNFGDGTGAIYLELP